VSPENKRSFIGIYWKPSEQVWIVRPTINREPLYVGQTKSHEEAVEMLRATQMKYLGRVELRPRK